MASESMVSRMSVPESCKRQEVGVSTSDNKRRVGNNPVMSTEKTLSPYRLVGLKGGLKLHVVPVRQDVAEGRLVGAKSAFSCLTNTHRHQHCEFLRIFLHFS